MQEQEYFEKDNTLQELLPVLWNRRWTILSIAVAVLTTALIVHFSMTARYRSTSILMIKDPKIQGLQINPLITSMGMDVKTIKNDITLVKSRPVAEKVVRDLYNSEWRNSMELFGSRTYESPIGGAVLPAIESVVGGVAQSWGFDGQQQRKRESEEQMIRRIAKNLQDRVTVENDRETNVLNVSVTSPFADEAALLTNAICQAYQQMDISWNSEQAQSINRFVAEQLGTQQNKVADVEKSLSGYMEQQGIYELTGNAEELLKKLIEVDSKYNDIMAEYNILSKRLEFIKKKLSGEELALSAGIAKNINTQLQSFLEKIKVEEAAYFQLVQAKGANDPEAKAKRQQIDMMKAQQEQVRRSKIAGELGYAGRATKYQFDLISEQLQTDVKLAELNYSAQEFQRLKNYYESILNRLPKKQLDFARLQRDREVVNNTYTFLKGKLEESRLQIASEIGRVIIVGAAAPSVRPESPDIKKTLLLGLILGFGLGIGLVVTQEMLDHTVKDEKFFEDHGFTRLALIPFVSGDGKTIKVKKGMQKLWNQMQVAAGKPVNGKASKSQDENALLFSSNLMSEFAESFRDLRTNISFSRADTPLRSILVTGTAMSEGKSTVCSNFGLSYAMIGKKVLIVDCDMRRPSQHKNFPIRKSPGLSDYLAGQANDLNALIQQTQHDNLFVLPAGKTTPNANELISSHKMSELVTRLEQQYDLVLLDSPPLLIISDSALLSKSVDGILMVARMEYTSKRLLEEVAKLDYLKPLMLGIATIGIPSQGQYRYAKYGNHGFYRYGPADTED